MWLGPTRRVSTQPRQLEARHDRRGARRDRGSSHRGCRRRADIGHLPDTGDSGSGQPLVVLLHGLPGPGVSAAANWRPVIPALAQSRRVIAPDQLGFAGTASGEKHIYGRAAWTDHALALLDTLGVTEVDVIGNSMGGAVALSMAAARPATVRRIVLMGTMGVAMALPPGLDTIWSYSPGVEAMREVIGAVRL